MTTHANCTHPKTKAARALCRTAAASGRTHDEQRKLNIQDNATASRRAVIADKHAKLKTKISEPHDESGDVPVASAISGFCGNDNHDRCPGGGKQWHCDCDCHTAHAE